MKILATFDARDYEGTTGIYEKYSIRAIIVRDGRLAMQCSQEGEYKIPGGGQEPGENYEQTLIREVKEETGLTLTSYRFRALITFVSDQLEPEMMCLFTADAFTGDLITCSEGDLKWVDKSEVPNLPTWEGDAIFLRLLLEDEPRFFTLKLVYEGDLLVEKKLAFY